MSREEIAKLIHRRRLQVWTHSVIYYGYNENLISDATWSKWASELEDLQTEYPDIAAQVEYADVFKGFDHSTGSNLPTNVKNINRRAEYLIMLCRRNPDYIIQED